MTLTIWLMHHIQRQQMTMDTVNNFLKRNTCTGQRNGRDITVLIIDRLRMESLSLTLSLSLSPDRKVPIC